MITYSYACKNCNHELEVEQSISDESLKDCPACNKPTLQRVIIARGGFLLTGGGWYKDGYDKSKNND